MNDLDAVYFQSFLSAPRKGDLQKLRIIQTAVQLLAKLGVAGLSMEKIAKELGLQRSNVIYHFKSKPDLLKAIFRFITTTAQAITIGEVKKATSDLERLLAVSDGAFIWSEQHPEQMKVMLLLYFIFSSDPKLRAMHEEIRQAGLNRLQVLVESLLSEDAKARTDASRLARSFQALITGLLVEKFTTGFQDKINYQEVGHRSCRDWLELNLQRKS